MVLPIFTVRAHFSSWLQLCALCLLIVSLLSVKITTNSPLFLCPFFYCRRAPFRVPFYGFFDTLYQTRSCPSEPASMRFHLNPGRGDRGFNFLPSPYARVDFVPSLLLVLSLFFPLNWREVFSHNGLVARGGTSSYRRPPLFPLFPRVEAAYLLFFWLDDFRSSEYLDSKYYVNGPHSPKHFRDPCFSGFFPFPCSFFKESLSFSRRQSSLCMFFDCPPYSFLPPAMQRSWL